MFKNSSFFNPEEALEQGQAVLKKQAQTTAQTVKSQVTGQTVVQPTDGAQPAPAVQDQMTKDFLKDLYAPSDPQKTQLTPQQPLQPANPLQATVQQLGGMSAPQSDGAKLAEARRRLEEHQKQHMETYYRPTFEQRPQQEERQADKVEREEAEEKQKRWELQQEEQKKNDVPIALKMATNKAEMFRGASG
jgi:hypothetical protein